MPPKKSMPPPASPAPTPVKIGLIRKVPGTPSEDVSTPIFSHSMMNALEDMVTQEGIGESKKSLKTYPLHRFRRLLVTIN